jgi:hypothetical protein
MERLQQGREANVYTGTAGNLGHRPPSPREARGECGRRKAIGAEGGGVAGGDKRLQLERWYAGTEEARCRGRASGSGGGR